MSRVGRFFIRKKIVIVQSCHQIKKKENGTFKCPSVFWHTPELIHKCRQKKTNPKKQNQRNLGTTYR